MKNYGALFSFTDCLYEMIHSGCGLCEAIHGMSVSKSLSRKVKDTAIEIDKGLKNGMGFSQVLKSCETINFPEWYEAFFEAAFECGNIEESLLFVKKVLELKTKEKSSLLEACIYPTVIILLSFVLSLFLQFFLREYTGNKVLFNTGTFIKSSIFLICSAGGFLMLSASSLSVSTSALYFKALSFLTMVVPAQKALDCAAKIGAKDKKIIQFSEFVKGELLNGRKVENVFNRGLSMLSVSKKNLWILRGFFSGADSGNYLCFEKAHRFLQEDYLRKRGNLLAIQQPVMICIAALYMVLLLKDSLMSIVSGGAFLF